MLQQIFFESIEISGYRGRNFELVMNPPGEHTVFVMDGNTGKTTTIELLRWCLKYKQSEALGKFRHMFNDPANVLSFNKQGQQTCSITINFSNKNHRYSFKRVTKGEYIDETSETGEIIGDRIVDISDTLEVDSGAEVHRGDQANQFLNQFKFGQSVDYFCFDGERVRDILIKATNIKNLDYLTSLINNRATHPILNYYNEQLEVLKRKIYSKAKSRAPDKKIKGIIEEIERKEKFLQTAKKSLQKNDDDLSPLNEAIRMKSIEIEQLDKDRIKLQSEKYSERVGYETQVNSIKKEWRDKRKSYFENSLNWISHLDADYLNKLKHYVREIGKLPEPYRKDLIYSCLNQKPPRCQICGRELNDVDSLQHVKDLEKLIASHEVQTFLAEKVITDEILFAPDKEYESLFTQYQVLTATQNSRDLIVLSAEDNQLIKELTKARGIFEQLKSKKVKLEGDIQATKQVISETQTQIRDSNEHLEFFKEYQIIIKNIEKTQKNIQKTQEIMKEKTIDIISDVLSESISLILGPYFSAKFSKEHGLLLGENNKYSSEVGGMGGKIILAYCFAEAMTLIDPIIIDTPSGNVGSHREALARHLSANHNQVICLCLPGEIPDFAPFISSKPIPIENRRE